MICKAVGSAQTMFPCHVLCIKEGSAVCTLPYYRLPSPIVVLLVIARGSAACYRKIWNEKKTRQSLSRQGAVYQQKMSKDTMFKAKYSSTVVQYICSYYSHISFCLLQMALELHNYSRVSRLRLYGVNHQLRTPGILKVQTISINVKQNTVDDSLCVCVNGIWNSKHIYICLCRP